MKYEAVSEKWIAKVTDVVLASWGACRLTDWLTVAGPYLAIIVPPSPFSSPFRGETHIVVVKHLSGRAAEENH